MSQHSIKGGAKLHYTSSRNGARPSVRQKHSYMHVRRLSRCILCVLFSRTALPRSSRDAAEERRPSFPQVPEEAESSASAATPTRVASQLCSPCLAPRHADADALEIIPEFACSGSGSASAVAHVHVGDYAGCYLVLINSSSTRCLIYTFTLNVTFLPLCPSGDIHPNVSVMSFCFKYSTENMSVMRPPVGFF